MAWEFRLRIDFPTARTVLCFSLPHSTCMDTLAFRVQRVDHEPVAGVDHLFAAQVETTTSMYLGAAADLCHESIGVFPVEIDSLPDVGEVEDLLAWCASCSRQ